MKNVVSDKIIEPLRKQVDSISKAVDNITDSNTDGLLGSDGKLQSRYLPDDILVRGEVDEPKGICPLNSETRVPDNNLPTDLIRMKDIGKSGGVAPLDKDGKVPDAYLPDSLGNNNNYYSYSEVEDLLGSIE